MGELDFRINMTKYPKNAIHGTATVNHGFLNGLFRKIEDAVLLSCRGTFYLGKYWKKEDAL